MLRWSTSVPICHEAEAIIWLVARNSPPHWYMYLVYRVVMTYYYTYKRLSMSIWSLYVHIMQEYFALHSISPKHRTSCHTAHKHNKHLTLQGSHGLTTLQYIDGFMSSNLIFINMHPTMDFMFVKKLATKVCGNLMLSSVYLLHDQWNEHTC